MLVTDEQIDLFARLSGDRTPLHFDEDFVRRTKFGRRVVHGGVTAAILNALVAEDLRLETPRISTLGQGRGARHLEVVVWLRASDPNGARPAQSRGFTGLV